MTAAVVVAPAPFKGALPAAAAARAVAAGVRLVIPAIETRVVPVADGGEGTLDALVAAAGGRRRGVAAADPLGRPVEAGLGELPGGVAVVELAQASGYERLAPAERDPERTGTWGTGDLIRAALDLGARRIVVGVGGSATTDGGLGLVRALGIRALDADGAELEGRGADMARVAALDLSGRDPRLDDVAIQVACDVDNPFHGPRGAAHVFGPQKGASPEAVARLDAGLARLAGVVRAATGTDLQDVPGAGAAGGAAGALHALLGAELVPGARLVLDAVRFRERLEGAALCITGEGRLDETSLAGKAPAAVAAACGEAGVPCVALCGEVGLGPGAARRAGFAAALPIGRAQRPLAEALAATEADLAAAGAAVAGIAAIGGWAARPGG
ncbi:MAG: glycerate kinase [Thermoleophilia bacterium]